MCGNINMIKVAAKAFDVTTSIEGKQNFSCILCLFIFLDLASCLYM